MEQPVKSLLFGNWLMVVCGLCYLAWWVMAFKPPEPRSTPVTAALLAAVFVRGMAGVYIMGRTMTGQVETVNTGIRGLIKVNPLVKTNFLHILSWNDG